MALPTSVRGTVDDTTYSAWLGEALENVPILTYPLNIPEYAIMRRDPTVAAILAGWNLQIRRASWALDGTGCRPAVVRRIADDLGLPILGADEPGPARVRGVSWQEHLRTALLTLVYGHFGCELQAEVVDGAARLIGLWERAPWTVNEIHVDPKSGRFLGITQSGIASNRKAPQISADRMVWYVREREGANWSGTSLLRPIYGVHLAKREALRVASTAHRRFGMGVPTVEWAPGVNPTPAQHAEAQRAASAARAGDQSGMALPPGATLRLVGHSGGNAVDSIELLKWLDSQMSRMALMPFLELGQNGAGGSRALGETFVDSWTLALAAEAENLADQATRQIVARLVEWNEGPGEPVPAIRVSGIGSRREVTAESLHQLLQAGALSSDPALEAWVRREYRLPERETAPPPAPVTPPPAPVAASRPRARKRKTPTQPALFAAAGDEPEPATDFAALQAQWETAKADLLAQWPSAAQPMVDDLTAQVQAAVESDDLGALGTLAVSAAVVAALSALIGDAGVGLAVQAAAGVVAEALAQGVDITAPDGPGEDRSRAAAEALAGVIAAGYATGAARAALQVAGPDVDPAAVADAVRTHLAELGTSGNGWVADNIGGALTAAQNAGRLAVMEAAPPARYQAREDNEDGNRCQPCSRVHLSVYDTLAEALAAYPAGGYHACQGGLRCRGGISPIWT